MTYLIKHNQPRSRMTGLVVTVVVLAVVVLGIVFWFPQLFSSIFMGLVRPFWRMEATVASGSLDSKEALLQEVESLKARLAEAEAIASSTKTIRMENDELKALMARKPDNNYLLAAVLKKTPLSPYDEVILDVGRDLGVSSSSWVYAPGNILIGKIADVMSHESRAVLFSSPGQSFDALLGPHHFSIRLEGRGASQYIAEVPRDFDVSEGDSVIAPSIDNIVLGRVIAISSDSAEPFKQVYIASPVDVFALRFVLVKK